MTGSQFNLFDLVLIPLTPIHVGGGDEAVLGPEDYRLKPNGLEKVNLRQCILDAPDRDAILRKLKRDMLGTMARVRDSAPQAYIAESVAISDDAMREIKPAFRSAKDKRSQRGGQINAFQRSGGIPIIPGSTLKGCLRTAWLAQCANEKGISRKSIHGGGSGDRHKSLERKAFELDVKNLTDTDPFRDVTVTDARIDGCMTKVDVVSTWKKDRSSGTFRINPSGKIQLFRERLLSVVDGGTPPQIPVQVGFRNHLVRNLRLKQGRTVQPKHAPNDIGDLLSALEEHHAPLWKRELEKFFPGEDGTRLTRALSLFEDLPRGNGSPEAALVRMGWAGHAESKSVQEFREIHRPQAKSREGKYVREGTTRHVVDLWGNPVPFGWALLVRGKIWKSRASSNWLSAPQPRTRRPSEPHSRTHTGPKLLFRKDQRVILEDGEEAVLLEDVQDGQNEVNVEIYGSSEPISVSEIKGLA